MTSSNEELFEHYRYVIDPKQKPIRIDKFLITKMEKVSRSRIQAAIRYGAIRVDTKEVKPNYKINPGQIITVVLPRPPHDGVLLPEKMDLDIRYEDDYLLVVHKPAGLVVHPGVGNYTGTLVNGLVHHFDNLPMKDQSYKDRPGLVHRIDKDTSGLLVVAKTDEAMTHLGKQFFDHTVKRKYVALVWSNFGEEMSGTITGNIGRNPNNRFQMYVFKDGEQGKHAVTHFRVLEDLYYVTLVECQLETGRTHQIRVHMKHKGHPLFNDQKYGGDSIRKGTVYPKYRQFVENTFKVLPRQALHAKILGFVHPITGEDMYFEAEPPEDFTLALERWRKYLNTRKELL